MKKRSKGGKKTRMSDFAKKNHTIRNTPKTSAFSKGKSSSNPYRPDPSGDKPGSQFRTRATINRLNMYRSKPNMQKMKKIPTDPNAGRVNPDRKWFGNVRTADQKELDKYRRTLAENTEKTGSGFSIHLKSKALTLSLVKDTLTKTLSEGDRLL